MNKSAYFDIADELSFNKKDKNDYLKEESETKYYRLSKLEILKENLYGKEKGIYYSLGYDDLFHNLTYKNVKKGLEKVLNNLLKRSYKNILIVGIGNEEFVPDSLGPRVVKKINTNYHLSSNNNKKVACLIPGVMAITGLESASIVKGVILENHIDLVIVIDSLVTTSLKRMNHVIQLTNTGISPGSGVKNYRLGINKKYLECDVISIGIGTAIPLSYIINEYNQKIELNANEKEMILTSKEIELKIDIMTSLLSEALNEVFFL